MSSTDEPHAESRRRWVRHALSRALDRLRSAGRQPTALAFLGGVLAVLAIVNGLSHLPEILGWMIGPAFYQKDFLQAYLLAKAMVRGLDPFLPLNVLAVLEFGDLKAPYYSHATPYPPTLGLILYPFTLLDYVTAARLWLGPDIAFLFAALALLARELKLRYPLIWALVLTTASLAWYPVVLELQRGQVSTLLLLVLAGAWVELRAGHRFRCGLLLGLALLVKPLAWLCVLVFLIRTDWRDRTDWRVLGGAAGLAGLGYLAAGWAIGLDSLVRYFLKVGPEVSAFYTHSAWNHSLWTIGPRLFEGTGGIASPPLLLAPGLASVTAAAMPAALVLLTLFVVWRRPVPLDAAFAAAVGVSLVVNPVAWPHYLVMALIPLTQVIIWLVRHHLPATESCLALVSVGLLAVGHPSWQAWTFQLANRSADGPLTLPLAPSLLMLGPTVAAIFVSMLVLYLEGRPAYQKADGGRSCA